MADRVSLIVILILAILMALASQSDAARSFIRMLLWS